MVAFPYFNANQQSMSFYSRPFFGVHPSSQETKHTGWTFVFGTTEENQVHASFIFRHALSHHTVQHREIPYPIVLRHCPVRKGKVHSWILYTHALSKGMAWVIDLIRIWILDLCEIAYSMYDAKVRRPLYNSCQQHMLVHYKESMIVLRCNDRAKFNEHLKFNIYIWVLFSMW